MLLSEFPPQRTCNIPLAGALNLQITTVSYSYSTVAIDAWKIPQGVYYAGDLSFLGMRTKVAFGMSINGVEMMASFDASEFSRVSWCPFCFLCAERPPPEIGEDPWDGSQPHNHVFRSLSYSVFVCVGAGVQ